MTALAIPKSSGSLSAEWLTADLQGSGPGNARISSFEYEPIAAGVGFLGKLGRLRLHYAGGSDGMPKTLICKLPTLDEKSRQLAMMFRFYEREVSFYRDIGARAGIRVPVLHHGAADPSNGDFVMRLEHVAPARVVTPTGGWTAPRARRAGRSLAKG